MMDLKKEYRKAHIKIWRGKEAKKQIAAKTAVADITLTTVLTMITMIWRVPMSYDEKNFLIPFMVMFIVMYLGLIFCLQVGHAPHVNCGTLRNWSFAGRYWTFFPRIPTTYLIGRIASWIKRFKKVSDSKMVQTIIEGIELEIKNRKDSIDAHIKSQIGLIKDQMLKVQGVISELDKTSKAKPSELAQCNLLTCQGIFDSLEKMKVVHESELKKAEVAVLPLNTKIAELRRQYGFVITVETIAAAYEFQIGSERQMQAVRNSVNELLMMVEEAEATLDSISAEAEVSAKAVKDLGWNPDTQSDLATEIKTTSIL